MTKMLMKTIGGYKVTYHSERKFNRFIISQNGKVVEKCADFKSCVIYVYNHIGNFERMSE